VAVLTQCWGSCTRS